MQLSQACSPHKLAAPYRLMTVTGALGIAETRCVLKRACTTAKRLPAVSMYYSTHCKMIHSLKLYVSTEKRVGSPFLARWSSAQ